MCASQGYFWGKWGHGGGRKCTDQKWKPLEDAHRAHTGRWVPTRDSLDCSDCQVVMSTLLPQRRHGPRCYRLASDAPHLFPVFLDSWKDSVL